MAATRLGGRGRLSEYSAEVAAGAEINLVRSISAHTLVASTTYTWKRKMGAAGRLRHFSGYINALGGAASLTIDILKNGASVLSGTFTLAADTVKELEGVGGAGVADGYFNTDSATNKAALQYEDGDTLTITAAVAAGGNPTSFLIDLTCDEQQPK